MHKDNATFGNRLPHEIDTVYEVLSEIFPGHVHDLQDLVVKLGREGWIEAT